MWFSQDMWKPPGRLAGLQVIEVKELQGCKTLVSPERTDTLAHSLSSPRARS